MIRKFFLWVRKMFFLCYNNKVLRYIFYGGLATLVNLVTYYLLRSLLHLPIVPANILSVFTAMMFAYFTNSRFVFESKSRGLKERFPEFVRFVAGRLFTMVVEVGGVWFMADVLKIHDYVAKLIIQFIVLVLNYIISKLLVFTKKKDAKEE